MPRIFISSTGKDLHAYREGAIEVCNRLGFVPIAMEFFESMGVGATEGSKRKLDEADVYVGIFAYRYGYIEDGYDKSVTEIEFDYAGERGLDRLCFIVDPDYLWDDELKENDHLDEIKALQAKANKLIRSTFTTVHDFQLKMFHSLWAWYKDHNDAPEMPIPDFYPTTLPPRPKLLFGREDDLRNIKTRLGVLPVEKQNYSTIIHGWPGVGKTTLVAALTHDEEVNTTFSDGVLWAVLGENPNPEAELMKWGRQLGIIDANRLKLSQLTERLRYILQNKKMLLIVDDVWFDENEKIDHAIPFNQLPGKDCGLLFTTRFPLVANRLATVINEDVYLLGVLKDDKALEMLEHLAPEVVRKYPRKALQLVQDLEGLPLALRVAGYLLASESVEVEALMDEIRNEHVVLDALAPEDRFDDELQTIPTVRYLFERSINLLDEEMRDYFAMLGAFAPKPATFDRSAMQAVWMVDDPAPLIRILVNRGLLEFLKESDRFWMHALLVKYADSLLEG